MPTAYISKLAGKSEKKKAKLEKAWNKAKAIATKQGKGNKFGLITHIFQKIAGVNKFSECVNFIDEMAVSFNGLEGEWKTTFKGKPMGKGTLFVDGDNKTVITVNITDDHPNKVEGTPTESKKWENATKVKFYWGIVDNKNVNQNPHEKIAVAAKLDSENSIIKENLPLIYKEILGSK